MLDHEDHTMGNVTLKIGVNVEPSDEFSDVTRALGFVRIVPCFQCIYKSTSNCPIRDDDQKYAAFCSYGRKADD